MTEPLTHALELAARHLDATVRALWCGACDGEISSGSERACARCKKSSVGHSRLTRVSAKCVAVPWSVFLTRAVPQLRASRDPSNL